MKLLLIRHAEPAEDGGLTEKGKREAGVSIGSDKSEEKGPFVGAGKVAPGKF